MSDKSTSSLVVDISKLKEAVVKAEKAANAARAEFRKTTAGMDNWSKSTEGLNAKIKQLNTSVEAEKLKLESLEAEYKQIVEKEGESSAAAKAHQVKIDNQTASVIRAEKELQKYKDKLSDLESDYSKATQEISKQEDELEALKKEYSNIILTQDKSSEAAQEVAAKIGKLSTELQENKKALENADSAADEFDNTLEKVDDSAEEAGDGFTVMKGALANLVADGIRNIASNLATEIKNMFVESTKAYSNFQAQTGESTEAMAEFKEEINDLYKNNYGDSLEDVADAMAKVKQQTNETDPSKLSSMTENALALRDTYEYDVTESLRAVKMLMDQFGISSDKAYNLIVQGAQQGLDKNGDLLDTINEYAVHYKQLGYNEDQFISSLINGTEKGTFSVDKLGDAMKEFGIRSKDTASTTKEGFQLLGYSSSIGEEEIAKLNSKISQTEKNLKYAQIEQNNFNSKTSELTRQKNADKIQEYSNQLEVLKSELSATSSQSGKTVEDIRNEFAKGGKSAQKATKEVLKKLMNMDDKVKQNQAGVDLFGTMWEDLGIEGVKALTNVTSRVDDTKDSMEELKKIKYDNLGDQFKTIGRRLQMDFIAPLAQKALPYVEKFADYFVDNSNVIINSLKPIGSAIAGITAGIITYKAAQSAANIITSATNMLTKLSTAATVANTVATNGATIATKALALAQKLTPWGMVAGLIGGVVVGLAAYAAATNKSKVKTDENIIATKELMDAQKDLNDELKNNEQARKDAVIDTEEQSATVEILYNKLKELNGVEKKTNAQKETMKSLVESLNEIMPNLNLKYDEEKDKLNKSTKAIEKNIEAQKNLMLAKAAQENASDIAKDIATIEIQNQKLADQRLKNEVDLQKAKEKTLDAEKAYEKKKKVAAGYQTKEAEAYKAAQEFEEKKQKALDDTEKAIEKNNQKLKALNSEYDNTTKYAENLFNENEIKEKLDELTTECQKAGVKIPKAISDGIKSGKYAVPSSVEGMKKLIKFDELQKKAKNAGINIPKSITNGIKSGQLSPAKAVKQMNRLIKFNEALEKADLAGKNIPEKMMKGILSGKIKPAQAIETLNKNINTSADKSSGQMKKTGKKKGEDYSKGIDTTAPKAQKSGKNLAKASKKGAESVSLKSTGKYFGEGFIDGLTSTEQKAEETTKKWGQNRVQNLNKSIESHSPSKATTRTGIYFAQGFINGIKSLNKQVKAESKSLGGASLKGILLGVDDGKFSKVGEKLVNHFTNGINSQAKNIVKTMKKLITDSIPKGSSSIKKAKEEFSKIAEQLTDSFTKSFEKGASKAVKKVEKAFESISEKYQDKYDEITQKQEDLQSTLSDYGELFERDDNGKINLSNLNEQINYLKAYDTNIKALKSKVSNDLMTAITSMSTEDGADLAAKLLSLSPSELKAFDNAYQEKQKISSQIAKDYYSSEVQSLKDNFTKQIKKQLKVLKKDLKDVGKQAVDGFIKGFNSKNSKVNESVENWAENIVETVKKQLKIKSPSRVFRYEVAGNIIDGFIKGIATRTRSAVKTMKEFSNKMTDSANISIGSAKRGMLLSSGGAVSNNNSSTYNFYQTNNSPKALSRLEIYRDTRNMIKFQAGLKGV